MQHFSTPVEIRQLLDRAMTVEELIDVLEGFESDAKVVFACDYGDITHTMQALAVASVDNLTDGSGRRLAESAYSNSGVAIDDDYESHDGDEWQLDCDVIVLS